MRTILVLALCACALGVPGALRAAEVTFAIDGATEYDSNVFRSHQDEKDDVVFRLRPWVQLAEPRGQDLSYSLTYALPVEFAVDHTSVDAIDQELLGNVVYHVNDRFQLFANNGFSYIRSELRTNFDQTQGGAESPLVNNERNRVLLNTAVMGASYEFTPRLAATAQLSNNYFDPSRNDRQQNWQLQGITDLSYTLTPKQQLGGGARIAYQKYYESQDIVGSQAQIYNVFGSWRWSIDEKTEFAVSAGPAVIHSEQDNADSTKVRAMVPFTRISGDFTAPNGFVDIEGNPVGGVNYQNGVVLLSQFTDCPRLKNGSPDRVLVSDKSCNPSVVLDETPGAEQPGLIDAITGATSTVQNQDPSGESSTDVTVFADATLVRHWTPDLNTALNYTREQGNASGLGGAVVGDTLVLSNTWNLTEKWQIATRGEWGLRKSVSQAGQVNTKVVGDATAATPPPQGVSPTIFGVPASTIGLAALSAATSGAGTSFVQRGQTTDIDTMRWGIAARVTRFFTRNTSGYLQFTYNQQQSQNNSLGDPSDFNDYLVTVGVQHVFTPIKLW
ncbi:MAG TPA: hypothetical protein VMW19_06885 [Myxococcota bacterium]|nr:hypothetical protein [Myxococcota bacterium]